MSRESLSELGLGFGRTVACFWAVMGVIVADRLHPPGPLIGYNGPDTEWTDGTD